MATKAQLIARIAAEVTILDETLTDENNNVKTYRVRHTRARGANAQGNRVTVWVYDEGGAGEQAIMAYDHWMDVPLANRYLDYRDTLPASSRTRNEDYKSVDVLAFREINGGKFEKVGIWNSATDVLDDYMHQEPDPGEGPTTADLMKFAQGIIDTSASFNPQNGRGNAIKVPLFDELYVEYPQGHGYIDVPNLEIVLPASELIARVDVSINFSVGDTTNNDGTNFHFQWQVDGSWLGAEVSTGFIKQESSSWFLGYNSYITDTDDGNEHRFSLWSWTTDRQGPVTIGNSSVIVEERRVVIEDVYRNPVLLPQGSVQIIGK